MFFYSSFIEEKGQLSDMEALQCFPSWNRKPTSIGEQAETAATPSSFGCQQNLASVKKCKKWLQLKSVLSTTTRTWDECQSCQLSHVQERFFLKSFNLSQTRGWQAVIVFPQVCALCCGSRIRGNWGVWWMDRIIDGHRGQMTKGRAGALDCIPMLWFEINYWLC